MFEPFVAEACKINGVVDSKPITSSLGIGIRLVRNEPEMGRLVISWGRLEKIRSLYNYKYDTLVTEKYSKCLIFFKETF